MQARGCLLPDGPCLGEKQHVNVWHAIERNFDAELVTNIQQRLLSGSSAQVDPEQFVSDEHTKKLVSQLFGMLVEAGVLRTEKVSLCPACSQTLSPGDIQEGICPHCNDNFFESGEPTTDKTIYLAEAENSRDIPWLLAIHGFNTSGEWQEDFSWLLATRFRHRAPALMHKFPILRYGVLFRSKHRKLIAKLESRVRTAVNRAEQSGIVDPPDIVAHSFGSLLFAKLLESEDAHNLRFGRIILAGSIVRPDYDWDKHIKAGRIDAVFNHCSEKDAVVDFAQYLIPDSGPSGRVGFNDKLALNYREKEYGHGTHFEPETMTTNLALEGPWDQFLRYPKSTHSISFNDHRPSSLWRPAPKAIRFIARISTILLPWLLGSVAIFFTHLVLR